MTELAKEYGLALYQLAQEEQKEETLLEETRVLAEQMRENPAFLELLSTPTLTKTERLSIADDTLRGKIDGYLLNFLKILIERGAVKEFLSCAEQYEKLYNKEHNIEKAVVITAIPLSEELSEKLKAKLEKVLGKKVYLTNRVDPNVLGGVSIEMDGKLVDDSLRSRLDAIHKNLRQMIA